MNRYSDNRMRKGLVLAIFFFMCYFKILSFAQAEELRIHNPSGAKQGEIFPIRIESELDAPIVNLTWNGRTITLPLNKDHSGKRAFAEILLAMPYEAAGPQILSIVHEDVRTERALIPEMVDWPSAKITLSKKYVEPPIEVSARIEREWLRAKELKERVTPVKYYGSLPFHRPVNNIVTSPYGTQRLVNGKKQSVHKGTDYRGAIGTPVEAIADGIVAISDNQYYAGESVYIDHGFGLVSFYCHMSQRLVKVGDRVSAGQVIGKVGATGRVTGPHLHLSVFSLGTDIDPEKLF